MREIAEEERKEGKLGLLIIILSKSAYYYS
jgi:hypothetical protein